MNDRGDEIDGAKQRRRDQENKSDQPESLAVEQRIMSRPGIGESCKWRIGSPTTLGCTARHEETDEHDHTAHRKRPETCSIHFRESHVRRADLQWHDEVSKRSERQRHYAQKNHDCAVHGTERVVKIRRHFPVRHRAGSKNMREKFADHWQRLAGISQLPAHQHHQAKAKEQEGETAKTVLNPDHFVIGGEDIFAPPTKLVMFVFGRV